MGRCPRSLARIVARSLPEEEREAYLAVHDPPVTARRLGGATAEERGRRWEAWLAAQHRAAKREDIAHVRKVGPPIRRTGPEGTHIEVVGVAPADFQGAIRGAPGAPWRLLAVEAKSHTRRLQRHDIEPHQRDDLEMVASVGGVALVAIELHTDEGEELGVWVLPWEELERRWKVSTRGEKTSRSVGPAELEGCEIDPTQCYLRPFAGGERA